MIAGAAKTTIVHATCVARRGVGVLLMGDSGIGKSDLALRLIERGAKLVADDRVELFMQNRTLSARAPEPLAQMIEVRGLGVIAVPAAPQARIALAVEMIEEGYVPRMPKPEKYVTPPELAVHEDERPPLIRLSPFEASAPAKIVLAAAAHSKALFREHRNP